MARDSRNLNLKGGADEKTTLLVTEANVKMVDHKAAKAIVTTTDQSVKLDKQK